MGGANIPSLISAHFRISAHFLTVQTYKRMRLTTRVYGKSSVRVPYRKKSLMQSCLYCCNIIIMHPGWCWFWIKSSTEHILPHTLHLWCIHGHMAGPITLVYTYVWQSLRILSNLCAWAENTWPAVGMINRHDYDGQQTDTICNPHLKNTYAKFSLILTYSLCLRFAQMPRCQGRWQTDETDRQTDGQTNFFITFTYTQGNNV